MTLDAMAQLRAEMQFMAELHKELAGVAQQARAEGMTLDQLDGIRNVAEKLLLRQADLRDMLEAAP